MFCEEKLFFRYFLNDVVDISWVDDITKQSLDLALFQS